MNKNIRKSLAGSFISFISGFLGAWAGADKTSKLWRRLAIPCLLTAFAYWKTQNLWVVTMLSMCGALSIGYGIPDQYDTGSALGRFWYRLFKRNVMYANVFTRGTIGIVISISVISIPIIYENWIVYLLCSGVIILTEALVSWRDFGYVLIKWKNKVIKKLLWVDFILYCVVAISVYITIINIK